MLLRLSDRWAAGVLPVIVIVLALGIAAPGCGSGGTEAKATPASSSPASDPFPGDWKESGVKGAPPTTIHVEPAGQGKYSVTWSFGDHGDATFSAERKGEGEYVAVLDDGGVTVEEPALPGPPLVDIAFAVRSEGRMEVTYTYDLGYPLGEETRSARFTKQGGAD